MLRYPGKLLNLDANAKTIKGQKKGFKTAILYLAPVDLSGFQVCPMASKGCAAACLNTAGRAGVFSAIQKARIAKTRFYFQHREAFLAQLVKELVKFVGKTRSEGYEPVVRLNGTSDILWERVRFGDAWKVVADATKGQVTPWPDHTIFDVFPDVQFYDYTKHSPFKREHLPANYKLTFSLDERPESVGRALMALALDRNVAIVFRKELPETFAFRCSPTEYRVVNGDESDLRHLDDQGVIVGLKAKGRAKRDTTGFVRA